MNRMKGFYPLFISLLLIFMAGVAGVFAQETGQKANRFSDNSDGTVTDRLSGLTWLKDANHFNVKTWEKAIIACQKLADDGSNLTDGSSTGDWRLPSIKELQSLIDFSRYDPALSRGNPFVNVQANYYWTNTTHARISTLAWSAIMVNGYINTNDKRHSYFVWPVRGSSQCVFE